MSLNSGPGESPLEGGDTAPVVRVGDTVRRRAGPWTPAIHGLLTHIRQRGFRDGPEPLGYDDRGREILTYVEGEAGRYPLPEWMWSEEVPLAVARLLRRYHDATLGFDPPTDAHWQWPSHEPAEVICHNDFAPYNVTFSNRLPVGVIDFDLASPGPRLWDVAYAVYRFAPLTSPENPDTPRFESRLQLARSRRFCEAYGLEDDVRAVAEMADRRLADLVEFIKTSAAAGDVAQQRVLARGDVTIYERDRAYIAKKLA